MQIVNLMVTIPLQLDGQETNSQVTFATCNIRRWQMQTLFYFLCDVFISCMINNFDQEKKNSDQYISVCIHQHPLSMDSGDNPSRRPSALAMKKVY